MKALKHFIILVAIVQAKHHFTGEVSLGFDDLDLETEMFSDQIREFHAGEVTPTNRILIETSTPREIPTRVYPVWERKKEVTPAPAKEVIATQPPITQSPTTTEKVTTTTEEETTQLESGLLPSSKTFPMETETISFGGVAGGSGFGKGAPPPFPSDDVPAVASDNDWNTFANEAPETDEGTTAATNEEAKNLERMRRREERRKKKVTLRMERERLKMEKSKLSKLEEEKKRIEEEKKETERKEKEMEEEKLREKIQQERLQKEEALKKMHAEERRQREEEKMRMRREEEEETKLEERRQLEEDKMEEQRKDRLRHKQVELRRQLEQKVEVHAGDIEVIRRREVEAALNAERRKEEKELAKLEDEARRLGVMLAQQEASLDRKERLRRQEADREREEEKEERRRELEEEKRRESERLKREQEEKLKREEEEIEKLLAEKTRQEEEEKQKELEEMKRREEEEKQRDDEERKKRDEEEARKRAVEETEKKTLELELEERRKEAEVLEEQRKKIEEERRMVEEEKRALEEARKKLEEEKRRREAEENEREEQKKREKELARLERKRARLERLRRDRERKAQEREDEEKVIYSPEKYKEKLLREKQKLEEQLRSIEKHVGDEENIEIEIKKSRVHGIRTAQQSLKKVGDADKPAPSEIVEKSREDSGEKVKRKKKRPTIRRIITTTPTPTSSSSIAPSTISQAPTTVEIITTEAPATTQTSQAATLPLTEPVPLVDYQPQGSAISPLAIRPIPSILSIPISPLVQPIQTHPIQPQVIVQPTQSVQTAPIQQPVPQPGSVEEYLKAYYDEWYKEWYRTHNVSPPQDNSAGFLGVIPNIASPSFIPPSTSIIQEPALKISPIPIQSTPEPVTTSSAAPSPGSVQAGMSKQQLDSLCVTISRTTKLFGIKQPAEYVKKNCAYIRTFYPQVTCEQISHVLDYCKDQLR